VGSGRSGRPGRPGHPEPFPGESEARVGTRAATAEVALGRISPGPPSRRGLSGIPRGVSSSRASASSWRASPMTSSAIASNRPQQLAHSSRSAWATALRFH
jgi:hypothetical protein